MIQLLRDEQVFRHQTHSPASKSEAACRQYPVYSFSVVVNTYNRIHTLEDTIKGLLCLDFPDFEIIVINGPSTDATNEMLQRYANLIKIGHCPQPNLSQSRNAGIAIASGDIVAFIDDDAVPHPTWLTKLESHYRRQEVGGVGGFTIDKSGLRWQVRKTLCDRYGAAYNVSDFFDERPLNRIGSPFYPSLLGTNSSFRRSTLLEIGGFDETFAYLLDETDVCLRIVDIGLEIIYEPTAIVYHKGASSDRRNEDWIPKTLLASARSKSYFIMRHGARQSVETAAQKLQAYRTEIEGANEWLREKNKINSAHAKLLNNDLLCGIEEGVRRAYERPQMRGDLVVASETPLKRVPAFIGMRIVLVSRTYPPEVDAGIARWTSMIAIGLEALGHCVHVITQAPEGQDESVVYEKGIWLHRVLPSKGDFETLATSLRIPSNIASWANRVQQEVEFLKTFGPLVVSFPIWDLEGLACLYDSSISVVMSLHTSYALAKPFKPEWNARPLYEAFMVNRMIAAERKALLDTSVILANSNAVVADLSKAYDVEFSERVVLAPHGTNDLLLGHGDPEINTSRPLRVLFVGRFENRKGFDIAVDAAAYLGNFETIEFLFVGGSLSKADQAEVIDILGIDAFQRAKFFGTVARDQLEHLYRTCDVVMMPSRYESFGLVAIEGMSAGKPVIALAAGGLKEVVEDGVSGFLIQDTPDAPEEIARAIIRLDKDRVLLAELSNNARRAYENKFTITAMASAVEKAYAKAFQQTYVTRDRVAK